MPMQYNVQLSPPMLFVGKKFMVISKKDQHLYNRHYGIFGGNEGYWLSESRQLSYNKLKIGIESLGLNLIDCEFGNFDESEGILYIKHIIVECNFKPNIYNNNEYHIYGLSPSNVWFNSSNFKGSHVLYFV